MILKNSAVLGPGVVTVVVPEGSDPVLPCSPTIKENLEKKLFDWKKVGPNKQEVFFYDGGIHYNNGRPGQNEHFKGRVFHFSDQLRFGNASIIIRNAQITDSGDYICIFPQSAEETFDVKLLVEQVFKEQLEVLAAAPKPDITVLGVTDSGVQLKCDVGDVHPQPKLQWEDSDGNVLSAEDPVVSESGGRYNVTLCTTVIPTKTNCFHCVVKQEGSYQVTDREITLSENLFKHNYSKVTSEGLLIGMFLGASIVSVVVAVLMATGKLKISSDEGSQRNANGTLNGEANSPQSNGQILESNVLMKGQGFYSED
ncbi:butyrophilin subfamily 3 member A2-like [Neolamprologus brichardi]|uniref:butyrophilin subfamily 3 member A2-like n=1 Tax=Neolamprologus brichardi TaxID=32507 RepID=UPI001643E9E5|nr:butyrophilin subfamily 3 member A2-like [Neolamprologus brichardi]